MTYCEPLLLKYSNPNAFFSTSLDYSFIAEIDPEETDLVSMHAAVWLEKIIQQSKTNFPFVSSLDDFDLIY